MVLDELEVLEDLAFLFNLAPVRSVVVDREHSRLTPGDNFLPVNIFHSHQQRERTTFHLAAEVVCGAELPPVTSDKKVGGDVLHVESHGSELKNKEKRVN